jgi:hypothetical protein
MLDSDERWTITASNPHEAIDEPGDSELSQMLDQLRALRRSVVDAWQARAVVLRKNERRALKDEIRKTCDLLESLVTHD